MDDDDGWDLDAVVRSCANVSSAAAAAENITPAMDIVHEDDRSAAVSTAVTSISFHDGPPAHEQPSTHTNIISFSMQPVDSELHARKRKSRNNKRVVEMREEELNNDGWAWRKYGQKPIKGSPYPRNYYRCSTTKDCSARRQVERSPINTSNFIVSYSGDHLHPRPTHLSTLAGTTRSTRFNTMAISLVDQPPCSSSSPASTSSISSATSLKEDETVTNDEDIKEVNFW